MNRRNLETRRPQPEKAQRSCVNHLVSAVLVQNFIHCCETQPMTMHDGYVRRQGRNDAYPLLWYLTTKERAVLHVLT